MAEWEGLVGIDKVAIASRLLSNGTLLTQSPIHQLYCLPHLLLRHLLHDCLDALVPSKRHGRVDTDSSFQADVEENSKQIIKGYSQCFRTG